MVSSLSLLKKMKMWGCEAKQGKGDKEQCLVKCSEKAPLIVDVAKSVG